MKKKFYTLLFALLAIVMQVQAQVVLNAENFPDANFRAALAGILGINEGDEISQEKINATTQIEVSDKSISDLKGIEHFTALTNLYCFSNQLTALDVSNNTALTTLYCSSNQLTALDVSNNTALTYLDCSDNPLTALDVSNNTALKQLYCSSNQLTALDVSNNTALTKLDCDNNQLTDLDVSNNTALTTLYCYNNRIQGEKMDAFIQTLPVSNGGNIYLIDSFEEGNIINNSQIINAQEKGWNLYYKEYNQWNKVPTGGGRDIDINDLLGDYTFYYGYGSSGTNTMDCQLVKTSSGYGLKFTGTPEGIIPVTMSFDNSTMKFKNTQFVGDWKTASVTTDQAIVLLMYTNGTSVYYTRSTTSVGLKGTFSIDPETADVVWTMTGTAPSGRSFYALRVANTSEGTYETLTNTSLSSWLNPVKLVKKKKEIVLNEENFPDANFRAALATELGISEGETITQEKINTTTSLWVGSKNISNLKGIEHFTALTKLYCSFNQLTALDVSNNTALTELDCRSNQLTALDVSNNTALTTLECSYNQLSALDVSNNTALTSLYCQQNQLTTLDVSNNTALTRLYCYYNQLTALDVSNNTALTSLYCYYNQLTALDVSNNTALSWLLLQSNQLTALDVSNNTALTTLSCHYNQLTALDVSGCTALNTLSCHYNQLTALDVSNNTALSWLDCNNNQLTALDVSKNNTHLKILYCYSNRIKGAMMDTLVTSLPTVNDGPFAVIDTQDENEGNVCTKTQVNAAKTKGWSVYDYNYNSWSEYEGSDELILNEDNFTDSNFRSTLSEILGINEDDEITPEMIDAVTTLNVSNKTISNLKGIEHFTELETLYCQLNQIKDADMDALIAGLPTRNVNESSPRLVAPRKANNTWGSLYAYDNTAGNEGNVITTEQVADANAKGWKVYQFNGTEWEEYTGSTTGITIVENNGDAIANWYTLDGKPLCSKPEKAGMYVVKMSDGKTKKVMVK